MTTLTCPQIEVRQLDSDTGSAIGVEYLCDREATYQINGTIYCEIHAKRLMLEKESV